MQERLVIRFDDGNDEVIWGKLDSKGQLDGEIRQGSLSDAVAEVEKRRVIVIVPGTSVSLMSIELPVNSRKQALAAVPYALEEQLAMDIEYLHFAVTDKLDDGRYHVAVVTRQRISQWLDSLVDAGIRALAVVPETVLIPTVGTDWSLLQLNGTSLLRTGACDGLAIENDSLSFVLGRKLEEAGSGERPQSINVYSYSDTAYEISLDGDSPELHHQTSGSLMDGVRGMIESCAQSLPINLLQGSFREQQSSLKQWKPWIPALLLLLAWAAVENVMSYRQVHGLEQESTRLSDAIRDSYREIFPNAKNIPVGMERLLVEREMEKRRSGNQAQAGFLGLLAESGAVIRQQADTTIKAINYRNGTLQITLEAGDIQGLDQLKQAINSKAALQADIQGATSQSGRVSASLKISGGAL